MERENGFLKSRVTELWSDWVGWASGRLIHSAKRGGLGCVEPSGGWGNTGYTDPNGHLGWCCTGPIDGSCYPGLHKTQSLLAGAVQGTQTTWTQDAQDPWDALNYLAQVVQNLSAQVHQNSQG